MEYVCSFCGKSLQEVRRIIAGPPQNNICDECVGVCKEILTEYGQWIDWKKHAKRFYLNWKHTDDVAMSHYGRYRKWQDRARRAEAYVEELENAISDLLDK